MQRRAYIIGAISSDPHYKYKFADCQMVLEFLGFTVFNPAVLPDGWEYDTYMQADERFLRASDTVVLLPDWEKSPGGQAEKEIADVLGKEIVHYKNIDLEVMDMKIKKGDIVVVDHMIKGRFEAVATADFDTKETKIYPIADEESGEKLDCLDGLCTIAKLEDAE